MSREDVVLFIKVGDVLYAMVNLLDILIEIIQGIAYLFENKP